MIDPLRNSWGIVNNSTQAVVSIDILENAEAIRPNIPPINATRVKVIP